MINTGKKRWSTESQKDQMLANHTCSAANHTKLLRGFSVQPILLLLNAMRKIDHWLKFKKSMLRCMKKTFKSLLSVNFMSFTLVLWKKSSTAGKRCLQQHKGPILKTNSWRLKSEKVTGSIRKSLIQARVTNHLDPILPTWLLILNCGLKLTTCVMEIISFILTNAASSMLWS